MVVCGGKTGSEMGSDCNEEFIEVAEFSGGRNAARFATISSISLNIAPSAAMSCDDLSSSKKVMKF